MLLQAWDQLYDCRNLDIITGVDRYLGSWESGGGKLTEI